MAAISEYILSVTAAAMVSAMVLRLLAGKGGVTAAGRMVAAVFVVMTVIRPVSGIRFSEFTDLLPDISADAQAAVAEGKETAKIELAARISESVEAYILDKAAELGLALTVQVELSEDVIPIPIRVHMKGNVSPYNKAKLQNILKNNLGLDKEKQIWA